MKTDVIIVGGGLAGAAAALGLSRRGISSTIIERQSFPRDKPCGEGLLPHGIAHLEALGLGDAVARVGGQRFRGILFRCGTSEARGDFERGRFGFGVRRLALDAVMHKAAKSSPSVEMLSGSAKQLVRTTSGAQVTLADGRTLSGRVLVGADGPRSFVRHAVGLDGGQLARPRYGLRQHFRLRAGVPMPERVEVSFQGGHEIYMTPVASGVVGFAVLCEQATMRDATGSKADRVRRFLDSAPLPVQARLSGAEPESEPMACGPLAARSRRSADGCVFLVGDAAGYIDAITGEGMSLALATAALAAESIASLVRGDMTEAFATAVYARRRASLIRNHVILTKAVVSMARRPWHARRVIARFESEPALFARLLAVCHGERSLASIGPIDIARAFIGIRPRPSPADLWTGQVAPQ